jgi:hypothetical protein
MEAMVVKRGPKNGITSAHKEALARGRAEGAAIRSYMEALKTKPQGVRGRAPKRPEEFDRLIALESDPVERVKLRGRQRRAEVEWRHREGSVVSQREMERLEAGFVKHVKSYSNRFGVVFSDWVAEGVDPAVLRKGGMRGSRGR